MKNFKFILIIASLIVIATSCEDLIEDEIPPTKSSMEGVWEVTSVIAQDSEIINSIKFPIVGFYLSSDRTILSTAGPLMMFIVYGNNKYTQIASDIDQVFNYASLDFNGGEFFVGGGVQTKFTLEMKLEGLPGQKALTTLLDIIGIGNDYLDAIVYHKFMDVEVYFNDTYDEMYWEIDNTTTAVYNTKDNYGNYVLWNGWPVNNFQRCTITLQKRSVSLKELVESAL